MPQRSVVVVVVVVDLEDRDVGDDGAGRDDEVGRRPCRRDAWAALLPELIWPVWGLALGAATLAYYLRRRGQCPTLRAR